MDYGLGLQGTGEGVGGYSGTCKGEELLLYVPLGVGGPDWGYPGEGTGVGQGYSCRCQGWWARGCPCGYRGVRITVVSISVGGGGLGGGWWWWRGGGGVRKGVGYCCNYMRGISRGGLSMVVDPKAGRSVGAYIISTDIAGSARLMEPCSASLNYH